LKLKNFTAVEQYERRTPQALTAPGAISLDMLVTTLNVDGTDAFTMAAPKFAGQFKHIVMIAGTNTPIANITVTGMRNATQDVWTMATFVAATAPRAITFYSPDGIVWDVWATVGTVTVA
jgi:hypothetical protein